MSDNIPLKKQTEIMDLPCEIHSEILKKLPVKTLYEAQNFCKQWELIIHSPEFKDKYHINQPNTKKPKEHYVLAMVRLDTEYKYALIVEDNTFIPIKRNLTPPECFRSLTNIIILDSINEIVCFYEFKDKKDPSARMAVLWNPIDGGYFPIKVVPKVGYTHTVVGFGIYRHPMFVKISVMEDFDGNPTRWVVDVFTLSKKNCVCKGDGRNVCMGVCKGGDWRNVCKGAWRNVYKDVPFKQCKLECAKVCLEGVIYFRALHGPYGDARSNFFISLDLESMEFGEVPIPASSVDPRRYIQATKVYGSLGLLEYYRKGIRHVCRVWATVNGVAESFTEIHVVEDERRSFYGNVLGFRSNGKYVAELRDDRNKRAWCRPVGCWPNEPMKHEWPYYACYPPPQTLIGQKAEQITYIRPIIK